jgi:hypothetical protein
MRSAPTLLGNTDVDIVSCLWIPSCQVRLILGSEIAFTLVNSGLLDAAHRNYAR